MNYQEKNYQISNKMSSIEQHVMASVAVIYAWRRLTTPLAFKVYGLSFSIVGVALFVSLPHVFANFISISHGGVGHEVAFIVSALVGTTLVVQVALLVGAIAVGFFAKDIMRISPRRLLGTA